MNQQTVARRALKLLSIATLILFFACIALACFLPLYTDEVLWRMLYARYFLEGGKLLNLLPACKSAFLIETPITWIPWRALDSWWYRDLHHPATIRLWGVVGYLCWVPWFALGCERILRPRLGESFRLESLVASIAPLCWCLFPFMMVINRPEQGLVGATSALVILSILTHRGEIRLSGWVSGGIAVLLSSYILAAHPKALFLLPVLLLCGWALIKNRIAKVGFLIALAFMTLDTIHYAKTRTACPEVQTVQEKFAGAKTLAVHSKGGVQEQLRTAIDNLAQYPDYLEGAEFQSSTGNAWIKYPEDITKDVTLTDLINGLIKFGFYVSVLGILILKLCRSRSRLFRPLEWSLESRLSVSIYFGLAFAAAFQGAKAFYEGAWVIPLTWLTTWILVSNISDQTTWIRLRKLAPVLIVISFVSQVFLLIKFVPVARSDWSVPGSPSGQIMQFQMSLFGYDEERRKMTEAASLCNITDLKPNRNLVIDDFTYVIFHNSSQRPLNAFFLSKRFIGKDADPIKILRDYDSDGLIARCAVLPTALQFRTRKLGTYCCLDPFWRSSARDEKREMPKQD